MRFVFLLFLAAILIWFLCSFLFRPIGAFVSKLWNDAKNAMTDDQDKTNNNRKDETNT